MARVLLARPSQTYLLGGARKRRCLGKKKGDVCDYRMSQIFKANKHFFISKVIRYGWYNKLLVFELETRNGKIAYKQ